MIVWALMCYHFALGVEINMSQTVVGVGTRPSFEICQQTAAIFQAATYAEPVGFYCLPMTE